MFQTETPVCGLPGLSGGEAELRNSVDGGVCCPRGQTPVSQLRAGLWAMPDLPDTPLAVGAVSDRLQACVIGSLMCQRDWATGAHILSRMLFLAFLGGADT